MIDLRKITIPQGFQRRRDVTYNTELGRYLWNPKAGDLFYAPDIREIFEYKEWRASSAGCFTYLEGLARVCKLNTERTFLVPNIEVRKCIPVNNNSMRSFPSGKNAGRTTQTIKEKGNAYLSVLSS